MFPNVRLLIGALFITVLVLSCEFGVFAALRVNREPLSRLTSESAPLQLVVGKNAPRPVPISWSAPVDAQAPAGGTQTGIATADAPAAQPAEHATEASAPSHDGAAGTLNNDNQPGPAILQTALAPSPAAPAPGKGVTPANPDASAAPAQETAAPIVGATADNSPAEQTAPASAAVAAVPQPRPALQAHETTANVSEAPAAGAPVIAAIAPAAAAPAPPAEITGSMPNTAIVVHEAPKAEPPHAGPLRKAVHRPAAKPPHKVARAAAQPHHVAKKHIARRGHVPAAAAAAQTANTFANPVFQSAPEFQRPTRTRTGARTTATNTGFTNPFGEQFGTH